MAQSETKSSERANVVDREVKHRASTPRYSGQLVARRDLDRALQRARNGAAAGVEAVDSLDCGWIQVVVSPQRVVRVDPLDHENLVL